MSEDAPAHKEYKVVVGDTVKNDRKGKETYQVSMSPKLPQGHLLAAYSSVFRGVDSLPACHHVSWIEMLWLSIFARVLTPAGRGA